MMARWMSLTSRAGAVALVALVALFAIGCDPVGADAYRAAVAAAEREQYAEAELQLRSVVRDNPNFGEAHLSLGTLIVTQVARAEYLEPRVMHERYTEAVAHWRAARACFAAGHYVSIEGMTDADKRAEVDRRLAEYEPILAMLEGDADTPSDSEPPPATEAPTAAASTNAANSGS